jgi:catechol 2,3-dioxygenase-like lactoylglutathione lyase family enzyme
VSAIQPERPALAGTLETVLYHRHGQAEAMERFYAEVLGLREVSRWPGGVAYRNGPGVALLFDSERSSSKDDVAYRHGAEGVLHVCFTAAAGEYEAWKQLLVDRVVKEITWKSGARSFFFNDPAGNLLEIAERDLWPE